jgi:CheY-like chemotaxis protein
MKTIVVADDEFGLVDVLAITLEDLGYQVHTANNGKRALETMREHPPDLVILDCMMPVLDGPGVLRAMRADPRLSRVPVVLTSGMPESVVRAKCNGFLKFLQKPFDFVETLGTVRDVLGDIV